MGIFDHKRRQAFLLRSPMVKATICRVRRHITVHSQRLFTFFSTKHQASSNSSTSPGLAGSKVVRIGGKSCTCSRTQTATCCRATEKIRSIPRKLTRSWQAFKIVLLSFFSLLVWTLILDRHHNLCNDIAVVQVDFCHF